MKKLLLIGKMNDVLRDINQFMSEKFHVQIAAEDAGMLSGLMKVTQPDLVIVSLVGMYDGNEAVFLKLQNDYPDIPVLTIGIKEERDRFLKFYQGGQFENILYPVEYSAVYEAVCRRLGVSEDNPQEKVSGKKRILVVDDNGPTLCTIKGMLEEKYEVQIAPSGMKAMISIGKNRPDLILLDYEMPVCDGRQTLEMIRADDDLKDIPVIFLTSVNEREHVLSVLELHPQGYILKPPVQEKLEQAIEKELGNK